MRKTMRTAKSTIPSTIKWSETNWFKIHRYVEKLQQRIFRAESLSKKRQVRQLQRLLMHSRAVLLLSIKKITQKNKGKKTAGIDGVTILSNRAREELYQKMVRKKLSLHKARASKRIFIKKKNGKLRPLSIPVIEDRIWQNVMKLALEPQWEYRFEGTSYGFRPGRNVHDAIARIYTSLVHGKSNWIFEGDFKGCFDNLRHEYILKQIECFPNKQVISRWLKAGYINSQTIEETESGCGQGSVISPLLANIALHGMESALGIKYRKKTRRDGYQWYYNTTTTTVVRFADDFVVICRTKEEAESVYERLTPYLKVRGLELEETKTQVINVREGFDFLGFNIRRYTGIQGDKLLIKPSRESIRKCKQNISETVRKLNGNNVETLISVLNPIIRGVANFWRPEVSSKAFSAVEHHIFHRVYHFLIRMHSKKSKKWINARYFKPDYKGESRSRWILTAPSDPSLQLLRMTSFHIKRHPLIRHKATPYDPKLKEYFESRKGR